MTRDFLEDFVEALEEEQVPYLIIVGEKYVADDIVGARVDFNLSNWVGENPKGDLHDIVETTVE